MFRFIKGPYVHFFNTTVALALLTSVSYFYAGLRKKGIVYLRLLICVINFLYYLKNL